MSKTEKQCNSCNIIKPITEFYRQYKNKHPEWNCHDSFCIPCRLKYGNARRVSLKKLAVEYKGGICVDCKLKTEKYCVYDFHHPDNNKEYCISGSARKFESMKRELDKCILLCSNCHRIRHSN
jgi:hypothetical protein